MGLFGIEVGTSSGYRPVIFEYVLVLCCQGLSSPDFGDLHIYEFTEVYHGRCMGACHAVVIRRHCCPQTSWRSRMSSPTGTGIKDSPTNTPNTPTTRQRTYPKPLPLNEHEFLLASNSNPDAPTIIPEVSTSRSILDEIAIQLNLQENREEIVKSWNKFTRQKIGVIASLRALGLSSCTVYSFLLIIEC